MKKYLQGSLLAITVISFLISSSFVTFAAVNPTGSNYNNNYNNKEFSTVGKSNAESVLKKDSQGNYTEQSIRDYQKSNNLTVDGKIGIETATALNKTPTSSTTAAEGNANDVPLTQAEKDKAMQDAIDASKDPMTDAERDAADQEALKNATKPKANSSTAKDNILGIEEGKLKAGDVDMNTIPQVIVSIISTLLAIAGTVAIFSLIYHAVKMQINSGITGDSSGVDSAKKGMIGALIGFVIAISAWFLVTQAVSLLGSVTY